MPANARRALPEPELMELELSKLFVDGVHELIFFGDVRQPHGSEGDGYGRDPGNRKKWLLARSANYKPALCRPLDVSERPNGMFAIIDGVGRWVMAQANGVTKLWCRVHRGLTRKQEAELYVQLDKEAYHQRQIDHFLAGLAAKDPIIVAINDAIDPYKVEKAGRGNLDFPGMLLTIHGDGGGLRVLRKASLIVANTWGKGDDGEFGTGYKVAVADFAAVALCVAEAPAGWNEGLLRDVLKRMSPPTLRGKVAKKAGDDRSNRKPSLPDKIIVGAETIAKSFNSKSRLKIEKRGLMMSDLFERMAVGGGAKISFGAILQAHRMRNAGEDDE